MPNIVNNHPDTMTNSPLNDTVQKKSMKHPVLDLLSSEDELRAGIRVTRAEFSRMMGCSRQAVSDWVNTGRVTVGADGRFDPRQAVASLLKTGDPSRIRAKVLEPLVKDIEHRDRRIFALESALASSNESSAFHEGSADELLQIFEKLKGLIKDEWSDLLKFDPLTSQLAMLAWLNYSLEKGPSGQSLSQLATRIAEEEEEGEDKFPLKDIKWGSDNG